MTADVVKEVLSKCLDPGLPLLTSTQLRFSCMIFLKYFGAIRVEEALDLLTENIKVSSNGNLQIVLQKGKCNQYKQKQSVYLIPALESQALCPVKVLIKWFNHVYSIGGSKYLFPNLRGDRTVIKDSKMTYNNLLSQWIPLLQRTNLPEETTRDFGLHSLRISAVSNASYGCWELEIQWMGRRCLSEMACPYVHLEEEVLASAGSVLLGQLMAMWNFEIWIWFYEMYWFAPIFGEYNLKFETYSCLLLRAEQRAD